MASETLPPAPSAALDHEPSRPWLALVCALLVCGVGAAAVLGSRAYPYWTPLGPGPGFFPRWLGVILIVAGVAWGAQSLKGSPAPAEPEEETPDFHAPTVLAIVVSLCLLAATLEHLGYQIAMFLFVLFHLLVVGRRGVLLSVGLSLLCSVGVFVAFTRMLTVPLPASSIPFLRDLGF